MKAFVVNLKRRVDRKKQITDQLPDTFDTYFTSDWDGPMDGHFIQMEDLKQHGFEVFPWQMESSNPWWNRPMKMGEVGCAVSHYYCWQRAARFEDPHYVFLEDDAYFDTDFDKRISTTLSRLNAMDPGWDLLFLGRVAQEAEDEPQDGFARPGFSYGAWGYMLSRQALRKIMATNFPQALIPVDEFLPALYVDHPRSDVRHRYPKQLRAYSVAPNICHTHSLVNDDFSSDIANSRLISQGS